MSKKNLPKKVAKVDSDGSLPEEEQSWVYQPIMMAMMRNKYSKSQLKSLVAIMIQMQDAIKDVIFNNPATIVIWADGTKTVVQSRGDDIYDPEKGLAMAISKKIMGNKHEYYHIFLHWLKKA